MNIEYLPCVWYTIILISFILYLFLDGVNIGILLVLPLMNRIERNFSINIILPTWDGNQTWLVFSLASFYAIFPLGFSILLPRFYISFILLSLFFLLRGVSLEFRMKNINIGVFWDICLFISALCIICFQIYIFFNLLPSAILFSYLSFINLIFLNFFIFKCVLLLGLTKLLKKTTGSLINKIKKIIFIIIFLVAIFFFLLITTYYFFFYKNFIIINNILNFFMLFFLLLCYFNFIIILKIRKPILICYSAMLFQYIIFFIYILNIHPYIILNNLIILTTQTNLQTLKFTIIPTLIISPFLVLYTSLPYYIFKGKSASQLNY